MRTKPGVKPLPIREYEADQILYAADPAFATEVGVSGPLPPLPPPNLIGDGGLSGAWDDWSVPMRALAALRQREGR